MRHSSDPELGARGAPEISSAELREIVQSAKSELKEELNEDEVVSEETLGGIPVVMNDDVARWVDYFAKKDRDRFQRFLDRGKKYRVVVQDMLKEYGLPPELYYLAMIESGYATHAKSHASAVGVWQFIRGTGQRYGLEKTRYVDERRDPIRSTEAAAKYLTDLYRAFQSWPLALAAYNSGEGRVLGAVMRGKTRDYWKLSEKKLLPPETRNYVPKFMAAALIGENPDKFGFRDPSSDAYPDVETVPVPSPVKLKDIARKSGVSYTDLKAVNPHLLRGITPPHAKEYEIWVPSAEASKVKGAYQALASSRVRVRSSERSVASSRNYHRVRRGQTLSGIAARYRVSVSYLKKINGIRGSSIYPGQKIRLSASKYTHHRRYHVVRRGQTLIDIARRYQISVQHLKRVNGIQGSMIYPGQKLDLATSR